MKKLIFLILAICFTGCSITGRYYIRNLSDLPATVTLTFDNSSGPGTRDTVTLKYANKVNDIKFGTFKSLKKSLVLNQLDSNTFEFTIPPRSTVFMGVGVNTHFVGAIQQAKIKVGSKEQTLTFRDNNQLNIKMRGLGKYTAHYDIRL